MLRAFILFFLLGMNGCGFRLATADVSLDLSMIKPTNEYNNFLDITTIAGVKDNKHAQYQVKNYKLTPALVSIKNTGNKWRQYEYTASWDLYANDKLTKHISQSETINLPSNQSPYQTQLISEQLQSLRIKLLKETTIVITMLDQKKS